MIASFASVLTLVVNSWFTMRTNEQRAQHDLRMEQERARQDAVKEQERAAYERRRMMFERWMATSDEMYQYLQAHCHITRLKGFLADSDDLKLRVSSIEGRIPLIISQIASYYMRRVSFTGPDWMENWIVIAFQTVYGKVEATGKWPTWDECFGEQAGLQPESDSDSSHIGKAT